MQIILHPTNHVYSTLKRRGTTNVEYTWCVCRAVACEFLYFQKMRTNKAANKAFCENSLQFSAVNYFWKVPLTDMFDKVLNTLLIYVKIIY